MIAIPFERPERLPEIALFGALFLSTIYLIYEASGYSEDARLIPLIVLSVMLLFLSIKLLLLIVGDVFYELLPLAPPAEDAPQEGSTGELLQDLRPNTDLVADTRMEVRAIAWVVLFSIGFYLFGLLVPIPILLFTFMVVEYDGSLKEILLVTVVWTALIYVLFDMLLDVRFYEGVIPLEPLIGLSIIIL